MTEALTESAAWGVGVGLVWWWTEFKPSLQTTFIVVHVGGPSWILGEPTRDDLGSCSGTLARPVLPFDAVIPLHLCVSPTCTAYTLALSRHVVAGEPRAH